jgi:TRAP-type C4-dicarboxylate transport system substrate-binding protein
MNKMVCALVAAAAATLVAGAVQDGFAAEVTLSAVSAFPKDNIRTKQLNDYIEMVNADGKGEVQMRYAGGPEVSPPATQPIALRNGVFDCVSGPPAYYLGQFPDADALEGFKTAAENRAGGGIDMLDKAARHKLGAAVIARPGVGLGLYMFLKNPPKLGPDGNVDLTGLKIRSSPAYNDFITALGGTPVAMGFGEMFSALERGLVDGVGAGITTPVDVGVTKYLGYRIDPPFSVGSILLICNASKYDALSAKAKQVMQADAVRWEKSSMEEIVTSEQAEKKKLDGLGMKVVTLQGKSAELYVDAYMKQPWGRLKSDPKVEIDVAKARAAFF